MTEPSQLPIRPGVVIADVRRVKEVPRPPIYCDAVQVTEDNKDAVTEWVGHEWAWNAAQTGDWIVTNNFSGYEIVIDRAFRKLYDFA